MTNQENARDFTIKKGITTKLGVTIDQNGVNFAVAVPNNQPCNLLLFEKNQERPTHTLPLEKEGRKGDIAALFLEHFPVEKYVYQYEINHVILLDPYAKVIYGRDVWGRPAPESKCYCGFLYETFDWEGDTPLQIPYEEVIAYNLHVRGFTKDPSSKVKYKGTFEGLIEKIPYLKELGINQIELMPAYDFFEMVPRHSSFMDRFKTLEESDFTMNYWGYGEANYFTPKQSYSNYKNPVYSFKNLVKQLHINGIELIMEFYFVSGTNRNLIIDCIQFWVEEYHIDGVHINQEMASLLLLSSNPRLRKTKIMSQGFDVSQIYNEYDQIDFKNIAEYNNGFETAIRRFLKGDEDQLYNVLYHFRRNPDKCAVMNYITSHDGFTLKDLVSYDYKHNESNGENNRDGNNYNYSWNCGVEGKSRKRSIQELRAKQIKNALVLLLLNQGVPMLLSGDEICNSQNGNNNVYNHDDEISWVNWKSYEQNHFILDFIKQLVQFRKNHPILHMKRELRVMDYLSCGYPDISYHGKRAWYPEFENYNRQLGLLYCGKYTKTENKKEDKFLYLAMNMHWVEHEFGLPTLPPNLKWHLAINTNTTNEPSIYEEGTEPELKDQRILAIKARTILVLIGK